MSKGSKTMLNNVLKIALKSKHKNSFYVGLNLNI